MCWEDLGAYHSLTKSGHQVPLCQAMLLLLGRVCKTIGFVEIFTKWK